MTTSTATTRQYYLAYGANLHPKLLAAQLGGIIPLSSHTVQVPTAFLSFDYPGIPYLEPAYTSAIVQNVNDTQWRSESHSTISSSGFLAGTEGKRDLGKEGREYKLWVWQRCCPGLDFSGELPPVLEGVAYEIPASVWPSFSSHMRSKGQFLPIECNIFTAGDQAKKLGSLTAHIPLVNNVASTAGLQPTTRYLRLVMLGAFFNTLSQPYLGHLILLRPYDPKSLTKRIGRTLFSLLLLPSFLLFHLPGNFVNKMGITAGRGLGASVAGGVLSVAGTMERFARGLFGSGFSNADE